MPIGTIESKKQVNLKLMYGRADGMHCTATLDMGELGEQGEQGEPGAQVTRVS
jgi:hypothetical protein